MSENKFLKTAKASGLNVLMLDGREINAALILANSLIESHEQLVTIIQKTKRYVIYDDLKPLVELGILRSFEIGINDDETEVRLTFAVPNLSNSAER